MTKTKSIIKNNSTEFIGKYENLQEFGKSYFKKSTDTVYEVDPFNRTQNLIYKRTMFGLKLYSKEELKAMHPSKIKKIKKAHKKAQHVLNVWKQEKVIETTNAIFSIFNKSTLCEEIIKAYSEPDPKFVSRISFKELGITKDDIVDKLMQEKVLPYNFGTLK
tara:strand:+ start:482 stop:967 length:486 start_codon:yes stop_codon:yes gene_type:complete